MSDFYDIRIVEGRRSRVVLDNSKLDEISESFFQGAVIRVLCGGSWGLVQTEKLDGFDELLKTAERIARHIDSEEDLMLSTVPSGKSLHVPVKKDPKDLSIEEKIDLLSDIEAAAKRKDVSSTQAVYTELETTTRYTNSEGLDIEYGLTRTGFAVAAVANSGDVYQTSGDSRAGICGLELFDKFDAVELAEKVGKCAVELLDAKIPKGGNFPVVLDQELAGVFVHEAVGHATEADIVLEGGSVLENRLGEMIGSELVCVKDDPTLVEYGYYPFDDEGSDSLETVLVDDGVLNSYLHSRETAARLGGVPRNARAEGYRRPVVRMSNTYMDCGDWSFDEILEDLKGGVYLIGSRGGQVNTAEGIFQFNAKRGYLVEKGECTELLRDVSLSGNIMEILKRIRAVGDDLKFNSGRCGKSGQLVPVSDGSPHLLIDKATVGGAG
jgi:TldD protein